MALKSTSMPSVTCGACDQISPRRWAVVRRMPLSGMISTSEAGLSSAGVVGLAAPVSIARCTSSLVTRPPGPVPGSDSASMLCRSASRRATGVTRDPEGLSAAEVLGCSAVAAAGFSSGSFAGAVPPSSIARCTSSLVTRPPGPVPGSDSASMLCRCANRCATGVARDSAGGPAAGVLDARGGGIRNLFALLADPCQGVADIVLAIGFADDAQYPRRSPATPLRRRFYLSQSKPRAAPLQFCCLRRCATQRRGPFPSCDQTPLDGNCTAM